MEDVHFEAEGNGKKNKRVYLLRANYFAV